MHRAPAAQRPTQLVMDIEDIRLSLERLSPRCPPRYYPNPYSLSSSDDSPSGPGQEDTHQIEINIEKFVATFKKACPDWDTHFTRVASSHSLDLNKNRGSCRSFTQLPPVAGGGALVVSTDSVEPRSTSSCSEGGSFGARTPGSLPHSGSTLSSEPGLANGSGASIGDSTTSSSSVSSVSSGVSSGLNSGLRSVGSTSQQNLLLICGPEFLNIPTYNSQHYLLNPDYVMGDSGCILTVLDVADILQSRYAFISGGKSRAGYPLLTFPDNPNQAEITDEQYKAAVNYLTSIPTLQEVDLGFALVVDRRQGGWGAVKTMLLRISGAFPGLVQEVLILRPSGFIQRTFTDMGFKFVKDDFKFRVCMCGSVEELYQYVAPDQLTEDLGGSISYNHHEWIQHRAAIEKFSANTSHIGQALRSLCTRLAEVEFPNDVPATEALIEEHELEWKEVKEDLTSTIKHGDVLLSCFKSVRTENGEEEIIPSTLLPPSKLAHVTAVERLLVQLEETERNFDDFWGQHENRLQQCLQLRKFEEDFKQIQYIVERQLRMLETMTDAGDSLSRVETLLKELADYEEDSKEDVARAEQLEGSGEQLIEDEHYAVDCIRPKCIELQRMCEQYKEMVRARYDILNRSRDLHDRIEKANKWCTRGVDILASQPIDKCNTPGGAEQALAELEEFHTSAEELRLHDPKEFRAVFETLITDETTKVTVQGVLKRIEDVQAMCDKRREVLKKQVAKAHRPVQPVVPEPAAPLHQQQAPLPASPAAGDEKRRRKPPSGMRRGSSSNRLSGRVEAVRDGETSDSGGSVDTDGSSECRLPGGVPPGAGDSSSRDPAAIREVDTLHAKRGHVMRELIDTERVYVAELQDILVGYADQMNNQEMQDLMPQELVGKRNILYGNMDEIYAFHSKIFLKDLENCRNTPSMVGKCFVARKEEFQIYSAYCQNKQKSEALCKLVGDGNPFFKECQKRLNHRLPLGAYLLKPVQRITKYQLLLKEMLRYTQDGAGAEELQQALDTMLSVLKYVNDIMHQVGITGFNGNIRDAGRLLMQGAFNVWTAHKKDKIRDIRFKPMQRHVFLYSKLIMFCKKKDDPQSVEKAAYIFKNSLDTASIGMTENVKGDKKKFEIWLRGRAEVYICQANNESTKNLWVKEIKKVLFNQFDQLKDKHKKEIPTIPVSSSAEQVSGHLQPGIQGPLLDNPAVPNNNNPVGPTSAMGELAREDSLPESGRTTDEYSDDAGWSSDEYDDHLVGVDPLTYLSPEQALALQAEYVALADYNRVDAGEISMREGDLVEVLKVGSEGWWYVRLLSTSEEGWAPASYLDSVKRRSSHSTFSMSSSESGGGLGGRNVSRASFNSNMSNVSNISGLSNSNDAHGEETLV